jgi:hypothetical protein
MSTKGSWTRVADKDRYEFNKTLIFMDTQAVADFLGIRLESYRDSERKFDERVERLYREYTGMAYDVSCMVDHKCEEAKKIRSKLIKLHEELYGIETT